METWRIGSRCTNTHTDVHCDDINNNRSLSDGLCLVSQSSVASWCSNFSSHDSVNALHCVCLCVCVFQARNKTGQVGYVPEKYLQFPTSNSLLSMLQSLATLDARSHTSSNSTEPELHSNCINGDTNSKYAENQASGKLFLEIIKLHARSLSKTSQFQLYQCNEVIMCL